ncbi:MAG TPA: alcohol dehydrogenase catalytic domain-containing protein [Gaiellaceae bacterium]|nr:alcohol dehydrogenase catalytic domain-containing protein [Gaiellaceae bacterium]
MKAVVLRAPGDVGVDDVPDPAVLDPADAVVAVRATAICGADLFPFHGMTPGFETGTVLGHEFAGEVVEVGAGVRSVRPGQRVVNASMISDGTCPSCRAGRVTQCEGRSLFGYSGVYPRLDGGQAELVRVPQADRALRVLPDEVSDEAAVFLADILPTGHAAVVRGEVSEGDTVAVVGCGPVGLMALLCASGTAGRLIAVDGVAERRRLAGELGAEAVEPWQAAAVVAEATDGLGADVVIEAAGSPGGLDASLRLARGRGVVSVVGAHFEPDYPLDNALMFERELTIRFSIGDPTADAGPLLDRMAAGELDPTGVITHRLPLAEAAEAYRLFDSREATKVVLHP